MKTSTTRLMIATAALAVAVCSASAQPLKAEIPMTFQVGNRLLAPGAYQIKVEGNDVVYIQNLATHSTTMLLSGARSDPPKTWKHDGTPKIGLVCRGSSCTLQRLWNGQSEYSFVFFAPKPRATEIEAGRATNVTVALTRVP